MDRPNDATGADRRGSREELDSQAVLMLFDAVCERTAQILERTSDWSKTGERAGQYAVDVDLDETCRSMLLEQGLGVLSEESGITWPSDEGATPHIVVVDPLDGSTNASLGLPWCATSLCLVSGGVPTIATVTNLRTGTRYAATRANGATRDGAPLAIAEAPDLASAIVAVNGRPPDTFRSAQYRSMGATALDIASVADPQGFDASIDFDRDRIGVWDYLAAALIVQEAGGVVVDVEGRELVTLDHRARRRPAAAKSQALLDELLDSARGA